MRWFALMLFVATSAGAESIAVAPAQVQRETVGARVSENIPAAPPELTARLARYQNARAAVFGGWLPDGSMIITTRFGETLQAHRVRMPLGMREQLTFYREPLNGALTAPGRNGFVFGKDEGGSEFWQLYWHDLDTRETTLLTDGKRSRNEGALWSRDGAQLAWSSTARNGTDTDVWIRDMQSGKARAVVTEGGAWYATDFSPDGKRLLVQKRVSINEIYPGVVDLTTGKLRMFPVDGDKAGFGVFRFAADGRQVYFVSDERREFLTLWHHDPAGGAPNALSAGTPWDVMDVQIAPNGKRLAFVSNEDGISKLHVLNLPDHSEVTVPALPLGVTGTMGFSPDGNKLALSLGSPAWPSDVYVLDFTQGTLTAWTQSELGDLDRKDAVAPSLIRFPTFDQVDGKPRTIPAFYYRPEGEGPFPVVISIHGGPEAQALPVFNWHTQFLLRELKVAVLAPNVRGSAGYGRRYLMLDDGVKREDSVRDIGALLDWIAQQPELDASRVGVNGGSYGGYMTLAAMTHYNDRLRAGVEAVGISHFGTFLENTERYRRDLRRAEYGDERKPEIRAFHEKIAPLNNAHKITRPLLVAQGFNDPRVPYTEAEQIVAKVRGNGGDVWYVLFKDEGHRFLKKTNADYYGAAAMLFWRKHLLDE